MRRCVQTAGVPSAAEDDDADSRTAAANTTARRTAVCRGCVMTHLPGRGLTQRTVPAWAHDRKTVVPSFRNDASRLVDSLPELRLGSRTRSLREIDRLRQACPRLRGVALLRVHLPAHAQAHAELDGIACRAAKELGARHGRTRSGSVAARTVQ